MKFLHTADWQIGMKAAFAKAAAARVREARLKAAEKVVLTANELEVDFMLVAGDLFEDNAVERALVRKTVEILSSFRGPVYLIPGNHDPFVPGSVWEDAAWEAKDNLFLLLEKKPLFLEWGTLFPCPLKEKHSDADPTSWIREIEPNGRFRIALAHGSLEGLSGSDGDHPISRSLPFEAHLDYAALGHWHSCSYTGTESLREACRMAYSGTHEPTSFGERDSGNVLLVECDEPETPPRLTPLRTAQLRWIDLKRSIRTGGDLERLFSEIEALPPSLDTLIRLTLEGLLPMEGVRILRDLREGALSHFLYAELDDEGLVFDPSNHEWLEELPPGVVRLAARKLLDLTRGKDETRQKEALVALRELYLIAVEKARR